jgi:predicted ribosome quality control (RQC) complex YloA/Tae2 family protein
MRPFLAEILPARDLAFHQAVAAHYWEAQEKGGFGSYQRLWRQAWKTHAKRIQTALENAKRDLEQAQEAELFQQRGMALVGELYQLGPKKYPKEKKIQLGELEIPLDPAKTFAENSELLFKKAKKLHRAVGELEGRMKELARRNSLYEDIGKKIETAKNEQELEKNAEFFTAEGIPIPERPTGTEVKKSSEAKLFLELQSTDGFTILCGRNQDENRQVTFRESRGSDIWLHVKGVPGAHVVVKAQKNKTVPLNTLLEAAQVCLYYSKIRKGKRAEVDYTPRKNVKAIKGTLAEVTYTGNKALYVEADSEVLKKILRNI